METTSKRLTFDHCELHAPFDASKPKFAVVVIYVIENLYSATVDRLFRVCDNVCIRFC